MAAKSILVSGMGIAGPTLAHWLVRHGLDVTLVEQAPRLRTGGYVVDFWGLGFDVAERMELVPGLRDVGYDVKELRYVDEAGSRVGGFGVEVFRKLTGGRYVTLARSDLSRLICRTIENRCEIVLGDRIVAIAQDGDGVTARFEHAAERRFAAVIGADGLHSAVRALAFGPQDRFETYLGYMVAAFDVQGYRPRDEGVYVSYCLPGKQVARFPLRDDRTMFLFLFAAPPSRFDPHDVRAHKSAIHERFRQAGWECPQILAALDRSDVLYFDLVSQIQMPGWSRGRVALVGDAAFCPSLVAGQGSALAMAAAYVLAGELARSEAPAAFARYEHLLRTFMDGKQAAAARFASSFAPKTRIGLFVRNQVTKMLRLPLVAKAVVGRSLLDRLELPAYPVA